MTQIDDTHDPARKSWVESANGHPDFPVQNLPLGVFSIGRQEPRIGVAIGDMIFDLKGRLILDDGFEPEQQPLDGVSVGVGFVFPLRGGVREVPGISRRRLRPGGWRGGHPRADRQRSGQAAGQAGGPGSLGLGS